MRKKPLAAYYPDLAAQLDPHLNGDVCADTIGVAEMTRYWWRCPKGPDHAWQASPFARTVKGHGCPFCANHRLSASNNLQARYPAIAAQLDADLNGKACADRILCGSGDTYWWRCPDGPDHLWQAAVRERAKENSGCPFCAGRRLSVTNSLAARYPHVAAQLDPDLNNGVTADQIVAGSGKKYWWRCDQAPDHVWEASANTRTGRGRGCPYCSGNKVSVTNNLAARYPHVAAQLDPMLNPGVTADQIMPGSTKRYWWRCTVHNAHVWQAAVGGRTTQGGGCPFCHKRKASPTNNLAVLYPAIAAQLDLALNDGVAADQIVAGSNRKYWWRCDKDPAHVWQTTVTSRTRQHNGCPYCSGNRATAANNLAALYPLVAAQLDGERNNGVTADQIMPGSIKQYWWRCPNDPEHRWLAGVQTRTRAGTGCPFCAGHRATPARNLARLFPDIAAQLDPLLNQGVTADRIMPRSIKRYWWRCAKGPDHIWMAAVGSRTRGSGCPRCATGWTPAALRGFLVHLRPVLSSLSQAELYLIAQQNGLASSSAATFARGLVAGRIPLAVIDRFIAGDTVAFSEALDAESTADAVLDHDDAETPLGMAAKIAMPAETSALTPDQPLVSAGEALSILDNDVVMRVDDDAIDFLLAAASAKIWAKAYLDEAATVRDARRFAAKAGGYAQRVQRAFLREYRAARGIILPAGYAFTDDGAPVAPNLMQLHVAAQVQRRRRVGNWSGPGAGKTLSAILASRVIEAQLTVVCCPNAVVGAPPSPDEPDGDGWWGAIARAFPRSAVRDKTLTPPWTPDERARPRYLILNYEQLQQPHSEARIAALVAAERIDMVIVDEVHYAKQRDEAQISQRKRLLTALIARAGSANPDLAVLGMSATPIINALMEGRSLVELITSIEQKELDVRASVGNAMAMYRALTRLGTRWLPAYESQMEIIAPDVRLDVTVIRDLRRLGGKPAPLQVEQVLTRARLDELVRQCQGQPTLLYTHYVTGITNVLAEALRAAGLRPAFCTGDDHDGTRHFIEGRADVLIGSSAVGTGIDGLQRVCAKLVFNALPWTHAEFIQIVGRLYRQGQRSSTVTVIVPHTYWDWGAERYSWCDGRWARIEWKRSLADAAVDGCVPEGSLPSPEEATRGLAAWLERLDEGETQTVERHSLIAPLSAVDRHLGTRWETAIRPASDHTRLEAVAVDSQT